MVAVKWLAILHHNADCIFISFGIIKRILVTFKIKYHLRMSGHRYEINHGSNQLLYQHFNLPDHSILSFKVRILEKIYHPTNNPSLSTPLRRQRENSGSEN